MYLTISPAVSLAYSSSDVDFSGSHDECTQPGPSNLAALTQWLQENNLKSVSDPNIKKKIHAIVFDLGLWSPSLVEEATQDACRPSLISSNTWPIMTFTLAGRYGQQVLVSTFLTSEYIKSRWGQFGELLPPAAALTMEVSNRARKMI